MSCAGSRKGDVNDVALSLDSGDPGPVRHWLRFVRYDWRFLTGGLSIKGGEAPLRVLVGQLYLRSQLLRPKLVLTDTFAW